MGQQRQSQSQAQAQTDSAGASQFDDISDAVDQITPYLTAQFDFREEGVRSVCDSLLQVDPPSIGMQLLKSGLKIGLAAAAGAVGAATGGIGLVAAAAIGAGFGLGGELVDAAFAGSSAPAGVIEYRTQRMNVLNAMKAEETSKLRDELERRGESEWDRAFTDYQNMQNNANLQRLEMNSTLDGWMNSMNEKANGTGGAIGEGDTSSTEMTTGRLFLQGRAYNDGNGIRVGINSASIDGLDNATLRNSYLDRSVSEIGCFVDFAFYAGREYGALNFNAGQDNIGLQGGDSFKSGLGYMSYSGVNMFAADHDFTQDWGRGARQIQDVLDDYTLRDFGLSEVSTSSFD